MSFTKEGDIKCRIDDVIISDPKFGDAASALDVNIHGVSIEDPAQGDWWRGEVSQNYGRGNFASMTQAEITFKTLRKLGFTGNDLTELKAQLMDIEETFHVKASTKDDKTYYNVQYIGQGGSTPEAVEASTVNARLKAIISGPKQEAPAAAATTPAGNPFETGGKTNADEVELPF